jgi:hypothetical protein
MIKRCSKCNSEFDCFVLQSAAEKDCNEQRGCWCEELFIEIETLKKLREEFDNCLCRECLNGYANKDSSSPA